jgi:aromatic ring-opening dioxygenase LigB subunit
MIVFAAITPHPPIILPEIGKKDIVMAEKTINAMLSLSLAFAASKPDIVLVISPHAVLLHDRIAIGYGKQYEGDFGTFGHPDISQTFVGNTTLVDDILHQAFQDKIPMEPYTQQDGTVPLDHGAMVPLYYFSKAYHSFDLVLSSFSDFSIQKHFQYGQILKKVIDRSKKRIAVIASGDMSHRLKEDGPYGFHPAGPQFDKTIMTLLQQKNSEKIIHLPSSLVDEAGECGYRSIAILMGILQDIDFTPQILSYEGPWGIGYLVANMKLS